MFGQMQSRGGENLAITRRREQEDKRAAIESVVQDNVAVGRLAEWEHKTDARIQRNQIATMARSLQKADEGKLLDRRRRLADLLAQDDEIYKLELGNLQETSAQKARRMVGVARALKLEREEKRKAAAQAAYNRQWREGCDDLRLIDSNKFKDHCFEEVGKQIKVKQEMARFEVEDDMRWAMLMEEERLKKLDQEKREMRDRQAFNYETKMALMAQMDAERAAKEREAQLQADERMEFRLAMEENAEDAKIDAQKSLVAKREQMAKIKAFNESTMASKAMQRTMQRDQEMRDLQKKLDLHKGETAAKAREKAQMRHDMLEYQRYLRERKAEEKEMEKELEILCQEEMERANAKRDMQWMQERLARENLLKDVYHVRDQQVARKEFEGTRRAKEVALERAAVEREHQRQLRLEEEEEVAERLKEKARAADLDRQMDAMRSRREMERTEARKEFEAAQEAERQYRAFLQREKRDMHQRPF